MALKASRKPLRLRRLARGPSKSEVAGLGCEICRSCDICRTWVNPGSVGAQPAPFQPRPDDINPTSTRPGHVIDDDPRNEAPGDAGCRASRRGADRPDRDVLVSQPGRVA